MRPDSLSQTIDDSLTMVGQITYSVTVPTTQITRILSLNVSTYLTYILQQKTRICFQHHG